jgi:hypothetical protein
MKSVCLQYLVTLGAAILTQGCFLHESSRWVPKEESAAWRGMAPGDILVATKDMNIYMTRDSGHRWIDHDNSYAKEFNPGYNVRHGTFRRSDSVVIDRILATHSIDNDNRSYYCLMKNGMEISMDETAVVGANAGFRLMTCAKPR